LFLGYCFNQKNPAFTSNERNQNCQNEHIQNNTKESGDNATLVLPLNKGAIVFSEKLFPVLQISAAPPPINEVNPPSFFNNPNTKTNIEPATTNAHQQTQTNQNNKKQHQHKPRSCAYSKQPQPHKKKHKP
jgi:hypothetical protein